MKTCEHKMVTFNALAHLIHFSRGEKYHWQNVGARWWDFL